MKEKIDTFIKQLNDPDDSVKINAIRNLAALKNKKAVKPLIKLLEDSLGKWHRRFIVLQIIEALGKLKAKETQKILFKALKSNLFYIKSKAAEVLEEIGPDEISIDEYKTLMHDTGKTSVRKKIVSVIGKSDTNEAIDVLSDVISSSESASIKEEAVKALGKKKDPRAFLPLMCFYYEEPNEKLKLEVIRALSQIKTKSSFNFLLKKLHSNNADIRECAAYALGEIGDKKAVPQLKEMLVDAEEAVRKSSAKALGMVEFLPRKKI